MTLIPRFLAVAAALWGAGAAAQVRPFTIDTVLQDLARTHPEASRVDAARPAGVEAREDVVYRKVGDSELGLDIYRPAGRAPLPAVLIVHGGGWLAGSRQMERPFAQQLAALGYVAVPISYRLGTPGRFPAPLHDLKAGVRWLRAHAAEFGVDPKRIAVIGGSAGGTLACLLGATNGRADLEGEASPTQSSAVQAVVDIDGTVSFVDNALIRSSEQQPRNPYWEFLHGNFREHREVWLAASPLYQAGPDCAPTLFIKSTVKQPILCGREEMCERLQILGIVSRSVTYPDTPHPFWLVHPWFERVLGDCDAFLREQLGAPATSRR